jgi:predicted amidophosphoribosyltransferase
MLLKENSKYHESKGILFLGKYYPYWNELYKERNPLFNYYGKAILDLKEKKTSAIKKFFEFLDEALEEGIAISVVPPHTKEELESGIKILAKLLARNNRIDASNCLVRKNDIPKIATGGVSNPIIQLESIELINKHLIEDKAVLLLDDVTTTETSLKVCKNILMENRAKVVQCLALGKTYRPERIH